MDEEKIIAEYKKIQARKEKLEQAESARKRENNSTFNLIRRIEAAKPLLDNPPVVIEDTVTMTTPRNGYSDEPYSSEVEDYISNLPEGCIIEVTIEVMGPVEEEGLTYTCDVCKKPFGVTEGLVKESKTRSWEYIFLCDEHKTSHPS